MYAKRVYIIGRTLDVIVNGIWEDLEAGRDYRVLKELRESQYSLSTDTELRSGRRGEY